VVAASLTPQNPKPGQRASLYVEVKNTGYEKAESVDLRVIRESGQPFDFETRSDFIGTLKPGESATAVLEFDVEQNAVPKEYLLKLLVRATGDSEISDTNVYTQELKASVTVERAAKAESESAKNVLPLLAGAFALVVGFFAGRMRRKQ